MEPNPYSSSGLSKAQATGKTVSSGRVVTTAVIGSLLSCCWHGFGLLGSVLLLDLFLAPPLMPMASYGQFGLAVVYVAFFGGIMGLLVPLLILQKMWLWILATFLVRFLSILMEPELVSLGWLSVLTLGQLLVEAGYVSCGILFGLREKRIKR